MIMWRTYDFFQDETEPKKFISAYGCNKIETMLGKRKDILWMIIIDMMQICEILT